MRVVVFAACLLAYFHAAQSFPFVLEGSGAVSGDVLAAGRFCNPSGTIQDAPLAVAVVRGADVLVGLGPTPYPVVTLGAAFPHAFVGSSAVAVDTDGDGLAELWVADAAGQTFAARFSKDCGSTQVVAAPRYIQTVSLSPSGAITHADHTLVLAALVNGSVAMLGLAGARVATFATHIRVPGGQPLVLMDVSGPYLFALAQNASSAGAWTVWIFSDPFGAPRPAAAASIVLADAPIALLCADIFGDGSPVAWLMTQNSTIAAWQIGAGTLAPPASAPARTDPALRRWRHAARARGWSAGDMAARADQVLVLRTPVEPAEVFDVTALVLGDGRLLDVRVGRLHGTLGQQEFKSTFNSTTGNVGNLTAPLNATRLIELLLETNTNSFTYTVCDCVFTGPNWDCSSLSKFAYFVDFLVALEKSNMQHRDVTGSLRAQVQVWLGLYPPTESDLAVCMPPADDPRTHANETAIFSGRGYKTYGAWALLAGQLAQQFPFMVAVNVDDMSLNIAPPKGTFTPALIAEMTSNMRTYAPWLSLASTVYYSENGAIVWKNWPDLALALDAPVFYFRNQKQGAGPCAAPQCVWGPLASNKSHGGGCLAGACADSTAVNILGEVADMGVALPPGRALQVGFYATGHSTLGTPTPTYVARVLDLLGAMLADAGSRVAGIVVYTTKAPAGPCVGPPLFGGDEGCIVRAAFAAMQA